MSSSEEGEVLELRTQSVAFNTIRPSYSSSTRSLTAEKDRLPSARGTKPHTSSATLSNPTSQSSVVPRIDTQPSLNDEDYVIHVSSRDALDSSRRTKLGPSASSSSVGRKSSSKSKSKKSKKHSEDEDNLRSEDEDYVYVGPSEKRPSGANIRSPVSGRSEYSSSPSKSGRVRHAEVSDGSDGEESSSGKEEEQRPLITSRRKYRSGRKGEENYYGTQDEEGRKSKRKKNDRNPYANYYDVSGTEGSSETETLSSEDHREYVYVDADELRSTRLWKYEAIVKVTLGIG